MPAGEQQLAAQLSGRLHRPGSDEYARLTAPRNSTARQAPAAVASVGDAWDVSACVRFAASTGLKVAMQATGHGAAGRLGADVLLIETSGMTELEIDRDRRVARVGAGVRSAQLNAAAERVGMLVPVGTAADVGVIGYTLYGGVGWMTRAFGMASASLLAVEFVDGRGELRRADEGNEVDALWAFRGGGGIGVAVSIELMMHPVAQVWGGYALWPQTHIGMVVSAWSELVNRASPGLSTVVSMLRTPSAPKELDGRSAVYVGAASPSAAPDAPLVTDMLEELPRPALVSFASCDAAELSKIHLDPPVAVPAIGDGRWLRESARSRAREIITAAHTDGEPTLTEVELRHVAAGGPEADGALTRPPGAYLLHAVGLANSPTARRSIQRELATVRATALPDDTGRTAASFRDGQITAPDALELPRRQRLARIQAELDPDDVFTVPRPLS